MDSGTLQHVLQISQVVTGLVGIIAPLTGGAAATIEQDAAIASALEAIVSKALTAYQLSIGEPMDLSLLHQINLIP